MRRAILILGLAAMQMNAAVVLDRIAVVAGKHAIKTSDIDRDIRVTAFLNKVSPDESADARCKSAQRLVDQSLIRDEITTGDYDRATDADAENMLTQIRRDRFAGSDPRLRQELLKYSVTEQELKDALLWQLTVLRFIDQRFRPAVMITDQDVKTYYDAHLAELKQQNPRDNSLVALTPKIQTLLEGQGVDKQFDAWLDEQHKNERIEYRQEAFK